MSIFASMPAFAFLVDSLNPVIVHIWGPLSIRWYGVAYVCGFICGYLAWLAAIRRKATHISREQAEALLTWAILGVLIGGRLGYMLLYDFGSFIQNPLSIIRIDEGGMSFHGGMLGVMLALLIVSLHRKIPFLELADLCAMAAPFGLLFGRLGNFVNGELWGKITDAPWAMIFPRAPYIPDQISVYFETAAMYGYANPRHPSQLYEAALEGLLLGAVLLFLYGWRRGALPRRLPGLIGGLFLLLYAAARILCEVFREPDAALILGVSRGTFYSILMALAGVTLIALTLFRGMRRRSEASEEQLP